MSFTETLSIVLDADTAKGVQGVQQFGGTARRELGDTERSLSRVGDQMTRVGGTMISVGAVAGFGLLQAADAASDLNEAANKSAVVFGAASGRVAEFARSAAEIGISERAALSAAGAFGNMFDQLGFASDRAADMSVEMVKLAADFASFHNLDPVEVLQAMEAGFRGEFDALQRLVPTINAAAVQQRAMADTGKENAAALTEAEKAAATYALIIDGAGQAVGDFERTSDGAANQQRQFAAQLENLQAQLGQGVLPILNTALGVFSTATGVFIDLDDATGGVAGQLAGFGTVALLAVGGLSLVAGQAIKAKDTLSKIGGVLSGLPASAKTAAFALGALGVAFVGLEILVAANEKAARGWVDEITGDVDTSSLRGVRDALAEAREELDRLDDRSNKGRLFSVGSTDIFATSGDREREDRIDALREKIGELEGQEESLADQEAETAAAFAGTTGALGDLNAGLSSAVDRVSEYTDSLRAMFDPLFAVQNALQRNAEAQVEVQEAQTALNDAIAQFGPTSDEATAAQQRFTEASLAAATTGLDAEAAIAQLNAAVAANPALLDEAKAHLQTMVDQGLIPSQAAADAVKTELDRVAAAAIVAGQQDPNIAVTMTGAEETIAALDRVAQAARNVPVVGNILGNFSKNFPRRQHGGPVKVGGAFVVGEAGPELFVPDQNGQIVPAGATAHFAALSGAVAGPVGIGGGGGVTNLHFTFNGPVASEAEATRWVAQAWNRAASENRVNVNGRRL